MQLKTKNTLIISILSALILGLGIGYLYYNKQNQDVITQQGKIHVDSKKHYFDQVTPDQVMSYQNALEEDIRSMLSGNEPDRYATKNGDSFMKKLFIVTGKPPVSNKENKKQRKEYYAPFGFELKNVGVRATGTKDSEIIADLTVKYNDKIIYTNLVSFDLNADKQVSGGAFYAKN